MVAHSCHPSTLDVEAGRSEIQSLPLTQGMVRGQLGLYETLYLKKEAIGRVGTKKNHISTFGESSLGTGHEE